MGNDPKLSVVIPIHNEEPMIGSLFRRLLPVLDNLERSYEVILINDGSTDNSEQLLNTWQARHPEQLSVIHFNGNFGQHMAIMAGFEIARGEDVITMDADCQTPPEDIPRFVEKLDAGHDVVGGYRIDRQDKTWRRVVSSVHNRLRQRIAPQLNMRDEGCMLRGFKRHIVELMVATKEASTFIPALALTYAANPCEVGVNHEARSEGETSYNLYKLIRYNFDLVTGFSLVPLQLFTLIGTGVSLASALLVAYMLGRRLVIGPEADGLFTLFAVMFLLAGIILMGLGILGEYIGRIYQEVRQRPRFVIREIREGAAHFDAGTAAATVDTTANTGSMSEVLYVGPEHRHVSKGQ